MTLLVFKVSARWLGCESISGVMYLSHVTARIKYDAWVYPLTKVQFLPLEAVN